MRRTPWKRKGENGQPIEKREKIKKENNRWKMLSSSYVRSPSTRNMNY